MSKWPKANWPGQDERFRKLEERYDQMTLNFENLNASIAKLTAAVDVAVKRIAAQDARIAALLGSGHESQGAVDAAAAAVAAEAGKLPQEDVGGSTGGITA